MEKKKVIIGVADAKVSKDPDDMLVTYSLGSCIGVCLYDPVACLGGLMHFQLPNSQIDAQRAEQAPYMFADTGLEILLKKMLDTGAKEHRIIVKIAGAANMRTGPKNFDIGKRNYLALRKLLWKKGLLIKAEDVGGDTARTLFMDIDTGKVTVSMNGSQKDL